MDILQIISEYIAETEFIPHPFSDSPLEFRYGYALGVTMGILAEKDIDLTKALERFHQSLNLEDKSEEIIMTAKAPTKELLVEVLKKVPTVFQKQMFILDINKLALSNKKLPSAVQEFSDGMIKLFQFTPEQKKTLSEYMEVFHASKIDTIKIIETCLKRIPSELTANLIIYYFKPELKTMMVDIIRQINTLSNIKPENEQVRNKIRNYKNINNMLRKVGT